MNSLNWVARFLVPSVGILLSCGYLVELAQIANWDAKFYPLLIAGLALVTCSASIYEEVRTLRAGPETAEGESISSAEFRAASSLVVSLGALIVGLNTIGLILSAMLFVAVFRVLFRCFSFRVFAIESVVIVVMTVVFRQLLHIPLPQGAFDRFLFSLL